jgi:hypothetical protein
MVKMIKIKTITKKQTLKTSLFHDRLTQSTGRLGTIKPQLVTPAPIDVI